MHDIRKLRRFNIERTDATHKSDKKARGEEMFSRRFLQVTDFL